MTRTMGIVVVALCISLCRWGEATTWYVDASVSEPGDGSSWLTAFQAIQQAIDAASDGDTVIVAEGTYFENVQLKGKNIVLTSTDPLDPAVVGNTIIDGNQSGSVLSFEGTEEKTCIVSGFTVRNGSGTGGVYGRTGGGICGGSFANPTHATIQNNTISDNCAHYGGAVAYCDGDIGDNVIVANSAERFGGGLYRCHGRVRNNTISNNSADDSGGGLYDCDGTIENNLITGNAAEGSYGGAMAYCDGGIENNVIASNHSPWAGGALYRCDGSIQNNTIVANSGGGLCRCPGNIRNCILWGNEAPVDSQLLDSSEPTYSCIQRWLGGGQGNIASCPQFVDSASGDFHLSSWSPCVDAGDPSSPFSNEPELNGGRINMGAYGNTSEAVSRSPDTDGDGLPDEWEMHWFDDLNEDGATNPDGDRILNIKEYLYAWDPTVEAATLVENLTKDMCYQTIDPAIWEADAGDEIVVHPGVYRENISFLGKNLVLRSTDPSYPAARADTVIDGMQADFVVRFVGTEDETSVLAGFTIQNGMHGGIWGGTRDQRSATAIRDNVISGNSGSGLTYCDGTIKANTITGNAAGYGGGLQGCNGSIENNTICDNSAVGSGGGLSECGGTILNNTICRNSAERAAGLYGCRGAIRNCIIWGNPGWRQLNNCSTPTYSCIQGWKGGGEGNIAYYPYLVDAAGGDYHLESWSPCIDAGHPASLFAGEPEPNGGRINMGAYGNTPQATSKSPDTDADGLHDDWEALFFPDLAQGLEDDPDGDLIPNVEEYRCGSNPAAPPSLWHVDASSPASGGGRTWETAFITIQEGIDAAFDRDTVIVAPGTYSENIHLKGKNIIVRSTDPKDADVVATTIIDGGKRGSVVTFLGTEEEMCTFAGFTIRNGEAEEGGGICGGKFEDNTKATIEWNRITGNSSEGHGGGIVGCDGVVRFNIIAGNSSREGGGLSYCQGTIHNNIIAGNSAEYGGGIIGSWETSSVIEQNTIVGNSAEYGGGLDTCHGIIRNCVLWQNRSLSAGQILRSSEPTYCCIEGWTGGGEGNMAFDPRFADAQNGDFHLESRSPCVDAGDPASPFSNEPHPNGGRVNMGAYGDTPEAASASPDEDLDGLPDDWELIWFGTLAQEGAGDADGDRIENITEYRYAWNPTTAPQTLAENGTRKVCYQTIQAALCESGHGDEIVVHPGVYFENVRFGGKNVVLRSTNPLKPSVVARTILDGNQTDPVVMFFGTEDESCVLSGFTIRNGHAQRGGGIRGGNWWPDTTHATIHNNVITSNWADSGGGIALCDGIIQNNLICDNHAAWSGGGLYWCSGIIRNNLICGNTAIEHDSSDGGGLCGSSGIIINNTIVGNRASGTIEFGGGGLAGCSGTIANCIIWGNEAPEGAQLFESSQPSYSCVQDWPGGGEGNTDHYPEFVDPDGMDGDPETYDDNDYRLAIGSPCIDSGENQNWMARAIDLDGNARVVRGESSLIVDMGAYEYRSFPFGFVEVAKASEGQARLTWNSRPGDVYLIWSCFDPSVTKAWSVIATIPSQGLFTTWSDPNAYSPCKFYRVQLQ